MGKIVYHEFLGNRLSLLFLALTGIGIPLAIVYILEWTVRVEESVESPSEFLAKHRKRPGRLWRRG